MTWDVPDQTILIDGDLAVSWGLNLIRITLSSGERTETCSRGTRVFTRRAGVWRLTHQHLSHPHAQPR